MVRQAHHQSRTNDAIVRLRKAREGLTFILSRDILSYRFVFGIIIYTFRLILYFFIRTPNIILCTLNP